MREHKFYGPWCSFFQFAMDRAKLNHSKFADLCGEMQQSIHQYVTGRTKPPLEKLGKFAEVLKLNRADTERFIWLGHQSYTPSVVWERLAKLEDLLTTMETEVTGLRSQLADLANKPRSPNNTGVE